MSDLIRRQDAIDAVQKAIINHDSAIERIVNLPSAQQWIPCSERLPNIGEDILFSVADLYTAEGCLRDDGDYCQFRWISIVPKDRVTAWMPLPEPFKGVEE